VQRTCILSLASPVPAKLDLHPLSKDKEKKCKETLLASSSDRDCSQPLHRK